MYSLFVYLLDLTARHDGAGVADEPAVLLPVELHASEATHGLLLLSDE